MKKSWGTLLLITIFFSATSVAQAGFMKTNYWDVDHSQPAWFNSDSNGGFYGETLAGEAFLQRPIITSDTFRIHRFEIANSFFYISDQGIILADNNLQAISVYLATRA